MSIFDFAVVIEWENRLANLAQMAEPERWHYLYAPSNVNLKILDNYVRYTFLRALDQQKMVEGDGVLCFNTGLLTAGHEEIFAVFAIADRYDSSQPISRHNKKWYLERWARSGDRVLTDFFEHPGLVEYWNDPKDLVFDPKLQVQLNLDHIIRDNLNRFPETLGGRVDARGVPTDLTDDSDLDDEGAEGRIEPQQIPLATRNALEGALKHSVRLAMRNYRVAVPQFHRGKIQLLLPVYLRDDDSKPDLALTLERHGGWYRAATVLYPDWAYSHARLLARPNSEWLGGFRTDVVRAAVN